MNFYKRYIEFVKEVTDTEQEIRDIITNAVHLIKEEPLVGIILLFLIIPLSIGGYFLFLLAILVILIYGTFRTIYATLQQLTTLSSTLSVTYTPECISEMLFHILKENSSGLYIDKPTQIGDLFPVSHPLIQEENGLQYYRFIAHHPTDSEELPVSLSDLLELLNLKLSQHLQMHFNNYRIVYEGIPVVKVFRVAESPFHAHCYDICTMLVDSPEKVSYLHSLESTKHKIDMPQQPQDRDF